LPIDVDKDLTVFIGFIHWRRIISAVAASDYTVIKQACLYSYADVIVIGVQYQDCQFIT
jgi:hypothetical protein